MQDCTVSFGLGNDGRINVEHRRDDTGWRKKNRSTKIKRPLDERIMEEIRVE
jgi:hypothetical protein